MHPACRKNLAALSLSGWLIITHWLTCKSWVWIVLASWCCRGRSGWAPRASLETDTAGKHGTSAERPAKAAQSHNEGTKELSEPNYTSAAYVYFRFVLFLWMKYEDLNSIKLCSARYNIHLPRAWVLKSLEVLTCGRMWKTHYWKQCSWAGVVAHESLLLQALDSI